MVADDADFPLYSSEELVPRSIVIRLPQLISMGIHDREYYRSENHEPSTLGRWSMVTNLIVVTVGVYILDLFIGNSHWLMQNMAATRESLTKPYLWWQLLSYGFAHDYQGGNVSHIFWNMFGLYIFGRHIEDLYGPREFLRIYLTSMLLGGIAWALRASITHSEASVIGASGAVTCVTVLFCIHFPKQIILLMMVLPVPAWVLGMIIIVGDLFRMSYSVGTVAADVHLVGAAFAVAYYYFGLNLGRWLPSFSLPRGFGNPFKRRPKLRVHRPHQDGGEDFEQLEARADELLQKVNRDGVDSLSAKEREILENYARHVRDKRR